jgi:hypothetical protein
MRKIKKINFKDLNKRNDYSLFQFLERGLNMEFVKIGKNYMIKDSNGRIVSEKEKLQLENNELILNDIKSNNCQEKTTKKISKNKKKIKELEKDDNTEVTDDIIKETDTTKE